MKWFLLGDVIFHLFSELYDINFNLVIQRVLKVVFSNLGMSGSFMKMLECKYLGLLAVMMIIMDIRNTVISRFLMPPPYIYIYTIITSIHTVSSNAQYRMHEEPLRPAVLRVRLLWLTDYKTPKQTVNWRFLTLFYFYGHKCRIIEMLQQANMNDYG